MTDDQKAQGRNHCYALFAQDSFPDVQNLHETLLILEAEVSSLHFLATLRERWCMRMEQSLRCYPRKHERKRSMRLRRTQPRYGVTFEQCRNIIRYFVEGLSVDRMVYLTGLTKTKIVELLFLTREVMLRDKKLDNRGITAYS